MPRSRLLATVVLLVLLNVTALTPLVPRLEPFVLRGDVSAGDHPLLHAPPCPPCCPAPLPTLTTAEMIVTHVTEHRPGMLRNGILLAPDDQLACARYARGARDGLSSHEAQLLVASLSRFARQLSVRLREGHVGLADNMDFEQEIALVILSRLKRYDESRASPATWIKPWVRRVSQDVWSSNAWGFSRPAHAEQEAQRFMKVLHARPPIASRAEIAQIARLSARSNASDEQIQAYFRLETPVVPLSAVSVSSAEVGVMIGAAPSDLSDADLFSLFERASIQAALEALTPKRAQRLAELIGLNRREDATRAEIARRLGISRQAVGETIRLSRRAIKNGRAAAELGTEIVASNIARRRPRSWPASRRRKGR